MGNRQPWKCLRCDRGARRFSSERRWSSAAFEISLSERLVMKRGEEVKIVTVTSLLKPDLLRVLKKSIYASHYFTRIHLADEYLQSDYGGLSVHAPCSPGSLTLLDILLTMGYSSIHKWNTLSVTHTLRGEPEEHVFGLWEETQTERGSSPRPPAPPKCCAAVPRPLVDNTTAESSARRLSCTDSRRGSIKRLDRGESQSEEDLVTRHPEMLDLQEAYNEAMQEVRQLELHREVLIFQVGCLQDALEGAEEMLAEAQREASDANSELERERLAKRNLEVKLHSLMQELDKLREERMTVSTIPVDIQVRNTEQESNIDVTDEGMREEGDSRGPAKLNEDLNNGISAEDALLSIVHLDSTPGPLSPILVEGVNETPEKMSSKKALDGVFSSHIRKGNEEQSPMEEGSSHPPPLGSSHLALSVDMEEAHDKESKNAEELKVNNESPLAKFQRIVNKTFAQMSSLAITTSPSQDGIFRSTSVNQGNLFPNKVMDTPPEQTAVPHIDAQSEALENTPDTDTLLTQSKLREEPDPDEVDNEDNGVHALEVLCGEPLGQKHGSDSRDPKNPDACTLS